MAIEVGDPVIQPLDGRLSPHRSSEDDSLVTPRLAATPATDVLGSGRGSIREEARDRSTTLSRER